MRAVLDTNVLISGLLWRGAPHECLLSAEAGLYELVLAENIFEELRDKLIHKFDNSPDEADEILIGLRRCSKADSGRTTQRQFLKFRDPIHVLRLATNSADPYPVHHEHISQNAIIRLSVHRQRPRCSQRPRHSRRDSNRRA